MASDKEYAIKVRFKGAARWVNYLSGKGGMNRLKIHAARFKDMSRAESVAKEIDELNPDMETKVVPI